MKGLMAIFFVCWFIQLNGQNGIINGKIVDVNNNPLFGATAVIKNDTKGVATDLNGTFQINKLSIGKYVLIVSNVGFKTKEVPFEIDHSKRKVLKIILEENSSKLTEVVIRGKSKSVKIEERGFNVNSFDFKGIKHQNLDVNTVLDRTPGVRVRRSGGIGSDFEYSLDGMSGNAIRFFIDGIPMDYYGSSYSINNLPISLIKRMDIYKGVVPVEIGSDALGGAINIVTNQKSSSFLETSYSIGSFNTHQIAFHGQWNFNSGLVSRLSSFYTYSDNNYKVWGEGVFYADESSGFNTIEFTKSNPAERFNDDFQTISTKFDIGYTNKKWADQLFMSMVASDQRKGVQTAQTMSRVYGKVRNNEQTVMPSLVYKKKNFLTEGLDVNAFTAYSYTKGVVVDTSYVQYDWRGKQIGVRPSGGEIGYDGKSLFTQNDRSSIVRLNINYELPFSLKLGINYVHSNLSRRGEDPYAPEYRIPQIEPQKIGSNFLGISLEKQMYKKKLLTTTFLKLYEYNASINELIYTDVYNVKKYKKNILNWGAGLATSWRISDNFLVKASLENAVRMPSSIEALGNGITISSNPEIRPEKSFNINVGAILGRFTAGENHGFKASLNTFYRDTKDKLLFTLIDARDNGNFLNIDRIVGKGVEFEFLYDFNQRLKFNCNATYLDQRNNLKFDEIGRKNIFFGDRMRNTPYFMANAGVNYQFKNLFQKKSKLFVYTQSAYIHEFYLDWPSAASANNKRIVPSQLTIDMGCSYSFPSNNFVVALDVSNILNAQVYDNYRLQKPGRGIFFKLNYEIKL